LLCFFVVIAQATNVLAQAGASSPRIVEATADLRGRADLNQARALVQRGDAWVTSIPRTRTTFHVRLPGSLRSA
jgi:hypothetical protein